MSPSSSLTSVEKLPPIESGERHLGLREIELSTTPSHRHARNPDRHFSRPELQQLPPLPQHDASLRSYSEPIEHNRTVDTDTPTPRLEVRRKSFDWGVQTAHEEQVLNLSRNPMMPQRIIDTDLPTMKQLVLRATTESVGTSPRRSSLIQDATFLSQPTTRCSSSPGTDIDTSLESNTKKLSVSGLARSMTRPVFELKTRSRSAQKATQQQTRQNKEEKEDPLTSHTSIESHKYLFHLQSGLKTNVPPDLSQQSSPTAESSQVCKSLNKITLQNTLSNGGGLAARRQVKIDLTLPLDLSNISHGIRSPPTNVVSSIAQSRRRSPKTPWNHQKELSWARNSNCNFVNTALATEEDDQAYIGTMEQILLDDAGLPPGAEPEFQPVITPDFVRPSQKLRDRCYISRPATKRNKSSGHNTSGSDLGSTPDGHWTPEILEGLTEQEVRTKNELAALAKSSKNARSRRWPWNMSSLSSSEDQVTNERKVGRYSISLDIFKRSNRFPGTTEKEKRDGRPSKDMVSPSRRKEPMDIPPLPSASLASMSVPPIFVPPGCEKVPTTPMLEAPGEVRNKLADFFFESGGFTATKRRPKASPGSYWDSDAILMSMQTDLRLTNNEDDEEGPEGRPRAVFHFGPVNDSPGIITASGLRGNPDDPLTAKGVGTSLAALTPISAQDSWFRRHHGEYVSNEESLTATVLKEADERRKFEWLIPEHLPNSPLCPLHTKYKGPSKGLCYWHGRKSNGWGVEPGRDYVSHPLKVGGASSGGWDRGKVEIPKAKEKVRRLQSLTGP